MLLYRDLLSNEELFTDAFPITTDDFLITIKGKLVTRKKGESISDDLIGGNPSQEDQDEACDTEAETISGIDVVLDGKMEDVQANLFPTKKSLMGYYKKLLKKVVEDLTAKGEKEKCTQFKKDMQDRFQEVFLGKYSSDVSVFVGENFIFDDYTQAPIIGVWSEDGTGCTLYAMKVFLVEEKL